MPLSLWCSSKRRSVPPTCLVRPCVRCKSCCCCYLIIPFTKSLVTFATQSFLSEKSFCCGYSLIPITDHRSHITEVMLLLSSLTLKVMLLCWLWFQASWNGKAIIKLPGKLCSYNITGWMLFSCKCQYLSDNIDLLCIVAYYLSKQCCSKLIVGKDMLR